MESRLVAQGRSGGRNRPTYQEISNNSSSGNRELPHSGRPNRPNPRSNGSGNPRPNFPANPRMNGVGNPRPGSHVNPRSNPPANRQSGGSANPRPNVHANPPQPNGPANPRLNVHVNQRPNGHANPPLHFLQHTHRSQGIIAGGPFPKTLTSRHHLMKLSYHNRFEEYLVRAGLYGVHQIAHVPIDNKLITALVERWREETHTFHLPVGEMTVTLQDVAYLLGLPIDGKALCANTNYDRREWSAKVEKLLGRPVTKATFRGSSSVQINFSWLHNSFPFSDDPDNPFPEDQTEFYVRAYILTMLGCVLFTDHTGDSVLAVYLLLLENLDEVGSYSWGSGVLAFLYRVLCRATRPDRMQIGGPLILLQMWSWERFPYGRPQPRNGDRPILAGSVIRDRWPPYGYRWSGYHEFADHITSKVTKGYRDDFDALDDDEVNWHPYENKDRFLPRICFANESLCMTTAPLIHFWIVEVYNPERVMRQLNRYQTIPPPLRNTCRDLHRRDHGTGKDWSVFHANHFNAWNQRWERLLDEEREYDETTLKDYMRWFSSASRLKLQTSRNRSANRPRRAPITLEYQPREPNIRSAVETIWRMARRAAELHEITRNQNAGIFARNVLRRSRSALKDLREFTDRDDTFAVLDRLQQQPNNNPQGHRRRRRRNQAVVQGEHQQQRDGRPEGSRRRQLTQVEQEEHPEDQPEGVHRRQVTQAESDEARLSRLRKGKGVVVYDEAGPSRPPQGRTEIVSDEAGPSRPRQGNRVIEGGRLVIR